jgi:pimeloyl-ACP methyl ester carboxylesterase
MSNDSIYKSAEGERRVMAMYDAVLAKWPAPHDDLYVPTRYGQTFVIAGGSPSNPPLILLHGASSNALSWGGDFPRFSAGYRVYAVDIPGDPGRSAAVRPDWNSPAYAEWLDDLLTGLKIKKVSLVGLSQGGWNALKFAIYRPDRVEKLVLLTPAGIINTKVSFLVKAVIYSMQGKRGADALNRIVAGDQPVDEFTRQYMDIIMNNFKSRIGKLNLFTDAELKRLSMPVFFIGGRQDNIQNVVKVEERLKRLVPHLYSKIYPDRGHVLINQADIILPFLQGI